jgi:hypothetical protein
LISDVQNGFRWKKSAYTAIQTFIEDIQKVLDNKGFANGIFFDLDYFFREYHVQSIDPFSA